MKINYEFSTIARIRLKALVDKLANQEITVDEFYIEAKSITNKNKSLEHNKE